MPYTLIRADEDLNKADKTPVVFLGGNCRGRDWRLDFLFKFEKENVTFINPRQENFCDPERDPVGHARQVAWERQALDLSDMSVFWLGEGLSNQASRVEIGYAIGRGKPVLIGADDGFLGLEHLTAFSGLVLSSSLEGLMNRFASMLSSLRSV